MSVHLGRGYWAMTCHRVATVQAQVAKRNANVRYTEKKEEEQICQLIYQRDKK